MATADADLVTAGRISENGAAKGNGLDAQQLRAKALEALHSLKSMGSNEDNGDAAALREDSMGMSLASLSSAT